MNRRIINVLAIILLPLLSYGQVAINAPGTPISPTSSTASFGKFEDIPVSLYTGTPSTSIPIYTVSEGSLSHSVSLLYHGSGNRVGEVASEIGLGWTLAAGGVISRTVQGIHDDHNNDGYLINNNALSFGQGVTDREKAAKGEIDSQPDIFSISVPGFSGKIIHDEFKTPHTIPRSSIKVERFHSACSLIAGFKITLADGTIYWYGFDPEDQSSALFCSPDKTTLSQLRNSYQDAWYLERIQSHDLKHEIDFEYVDHKYSYEVLPECRVMAYIDNSGNQQTDEQCDLDNPHLVEVRAKVLDQITTSTTTIDFKHFRREDLQDYNDVHNVLGQLTGVSQGLGINEIEIKEGSGTDHIMKYVMIQSYFMDDSHILNPSEPIEGYKRLKLDALQLISVSDPSLSEPPYEFDYGGNFFPNYLNRRIDHWGYYNGVVNNDGLDNLIPFTEELVGGDIVSFGNANRSSSSFNMQHGMLKSIEYPTGGSTSFQYEANTVLTTGPSTPQNLFWIESCNPNCGGLNINSFTFTMTQDILDDGVYEFCLSGIDDGVLTGLNLFSNIGFFNVIESGVTISSQSFNVDPINLSACLSGTLSSLTSFTVGTSYTFEIRTSNVYGSLSVNYEQNGAASNKPVGGLRVKQVTTHDGIDATKDMVKTYKYQDANDSSKSSGILFNDPKHSAVLNAGNVLFKSYSVLPMSGFEGFHLGYERVVVDYNGNGEEEYIHFINDNDADYSDYPPAPPEPRLEAGNLKEQKTYREDGQLLASADNTRYPDSGYNLSGFRYTVDNLEGFNTNTGGVDEFPATIYDVPINIFRVFKSTSSIDGLSTTQTNQYLTNGVHYAPTSASSTNSDGVFSQVSTIYTADYSYSTAIKNELNSRNIKEVPFESTVFTNGNTVDGSRVLYGFFSGSGNYQGTTSGTDPYPRSFDQFETTWDASGNFVNNLWDNVATVNEYNNDGLIKEYQRKNWLPETYNYINKQLSGKSFDGHTTSYERYPNGRLLKKMKPVDGINTEYEYDGLMRLKKITKPCNSSTTDIEYDIKKVTATDRSSIKTTNTFQADPLGLSAVTNLISYEYKDGLNRTIETVAENQNYDGNKDVISAIEYDKYGRVVKQYEPVESTGSGGFVSINNSWPHTLNTFEESPLSRPIEVLIPDWPQPNKTTYATNDAADAVILDHGAATIYPDDELSKTTSIDGNGNRSIVFTDKKGRTILKRRANAADAASSRHDTYYLYDDKNRVTTVIPPGSSLSSPDLNFEYLYDATDNVIEKEIPGKDMMEYVYNNRDLLSLQNDGNLKAQNKWYGFEYDDHGREIASGFYTSSPPTAPFANISPTEMLTENVYYGAGSGTSAGKLERAKARNLSNTDWYETFLQYDNCGRNHIDLVQHHISGVLDEVNRYFDGANNVVKDVYSHPLQLPGTTPDIIIENSYELKSNGDQYRHHFKLNADPSYLLSEHRYDHKGQMTIKKVGSNNAGSSFLQQSNYSYRDNGLLTTINTPSMPGNELFHMELNYDVAKTGTSPGLRENGDIVNTTWHNKGNNAQVFSYDYDHLNRLSEANYEGTIGDYDTGYSYDQRGNITALERNGMIASGGSYSSTDIDDLSYTYGAGNKLQSISDAGEQDHGYKKANGTNYVYDPNGNLIHDPQKGIDISYNHLDLVELIDFTDGRKIDFTYDGSGSLLKKETYYQNNLIEWKDYVGGIEYTNGDIEYVYHAEGRARDLGHCPTMIQVVGILDGEYHFRSKVIQSDAIEQESFHSDVDMEATQSICLLPGFEVKPMAEFHAYIGTLQTGFQHEFTAVDHLGNTRLTYSDLDENGSIDPATEFIQQNHYYPFGLKMRGAWENKKFSDYSLQYNGIEYFDEWGLDINIASFRTLDPAIARWWSLDPDTEQFKGLNGYNQNFNNPLTFSDPNGDNPLLIGAGIGLIMNGANNYANGDSFFKGAGQAAFFGALGGGISSGIGDAAVTLGSSTAVGGAGWSKGAVIAFQAGAHSLTGGVLSEAQGGKFWHGAAAGAFSSLTGSAIGKSGWGQWLGGGLSGGVGSVIAGGNFFDGARQGLITGGLNHAAHTLLGGAQTDPPQKGDKKLSNGSYGGVLEFDGEKWNATGEFVMASGQVQVAPAPWEYVMGGGLIRSGINNLGRSSKLLYDVGYKTIFRRQVILNQKYFSGLKVGKIRIQFHKHRLHGSSNYLPHININNTHFMLSWEGIKKYGFIYRPK